MTNLRIAPLLLATLLAACAAPQMERPGPAAMTPAKKTVTVGISGINDFHGALESPKQSVFVPDGKGGTMPVPAGGAAYLATAIDGLRSQYTNHLVVSAGDLISASQLASALFLDEPTITVMNRIGLDFNAVGNHEFDRGRDELLRMQAGGCAQHTATRPCQLETFKGAQFRFLSASTMTETGQTLFPGTALRSFGKGRSKVTIGLIGLTLKGTPDLVSAEGIKGLTFADEAATINAAVPQLKAAGADAVVVLIHQGVRTKGIPNPQGCEQAGGEIEPILQQLDPRVDVIVSGHTHWAYVCEYPSRDPQRPFLLTSAGVFGELVTDITLEIDPDANRVVSRTARNVIVQSEAYRSSPDRIVAINPAFRQFVPQADIADYVARYARAAQDYALRPIGRIAGLAERPNGEGSSTGGSLGHLIADAQLGATVGAGAEIAFMNPFGIRSPWKLSPGADGTLTFGDLYQIQPFNNMLVTQSLTGAQLRRILEQNFDGIGPDQALSPSRGFAYSYDLSRPIGQRIITVTLNGEPLRDDRTYRVTTSDFLAAGGDTYSELAKGSNRVIGISDRAALEAWLKAIPPREVPLEERTTELGKR